MTRSEITFLGLIRTALDESGSHDDYVIEENIVWNEVFHLAEQHHILPIRLYALVARGLFFHYV